jgi:recombination protein RecT
MNAPLAKTDTTDPQQTLKSALERIKPALEAVLPKHVTAERVLKVVLSATARNPDILKCTTASICRAVMQAGELGLEIGGLLGEAYIVPFNVKVKEAGRADRWEKQATCIPGYKGLIKLARQSGEIATINARVVYADDDFDVELAEERITHRMSMNGARTDAELVAAYCIIRYREGPTQIDVMTRAELEKTRSRSQAKDNGPWVTDFPEMCRKTVTKRAIKYAPVSATLTKALEIGAEADALDERGQDLPDMRLLDVVEAPQGRRLAEAVRSRNGKAKAAEVEGTPHPDHVSEPADSEPPDDVALGGDPDKGP